MLHLLDAFTIHFNREDSVAKTSGASNGITVAAEAVGSALGRVAGTVDRLKAEHPHPIDEAREALAEGQAIVSDTATAATEGVSAVIDTARKAVATVRKSVSRARKPAKRAKTGRTGKAVARARKTARRVTVRVKKTARRVTA